MSQQFALNTIELAFASDRTQVGGKALHLQRALSLGLRVPPGYVIPCSAFTRFLAENALAAQVDDYLTFARASGGKELRDHYEMLCAAMMAAQLPVDLEQDVAVEAERLLAHAPAGLAVRSSAIYEDGSNASFAGVYDSYLGITTHAALWEAIRRCWCASWSPGALAYAHRMKIYVQPDGMALLVQQLLPAECAGVVFTAEPLTGNPWRFVINATYGLAQELINGSTPADSFVVDWDTREVLAQQIVEKVTMMHGSKDGIVAAAVPSQCQLEMGMDDN